MANTVPTSNPPKTLTGARCVVYVDGNAVGTFDSISYAENLSTESIHVLGRYGAVEIVPNSYESINVNCSGYRVLDAGPHTTPRFPSLDSLLTISTINLEVHDRQSGKVIGFVYGCIPSSNSVNYHSKSTSRTSIGFHGLWASDESLPNGQAEGTGTSNEPVPSWP